MRFLIWMVVLATSPLIQPLVPDTNRAYLLYLAQKGDAERAIAGYQTMAEEHGHDRIFLRDLACVILKQGQYCSSQAGRKLALFGAGLVQDRELLGLFREALTSHDEGMLLAAITLISKLDVEEADDLLLTAMGSPLLLARLEAGYQLLRRGHPQAVPQLQALMAKLPKEAEPIFSELYALADDPEADRILRQLMSKGSSLSSRAAILGLAERGRNDFLAEMRRSSRRVDPLQQEASAIALGKLQDLVSVDRLEQLSRSPETGVQIAALTALYALGYDEGAKGLHRHAAEGNCFAIAQLANVPEARALLVRLTQHNDPDIRLNASIALLEHRDSRCVPGILEALITNQRDRGVSLLVSASGALHHFAFLSSLEAHSHKSPEVQEVSTTIREALLVSALELNENAFLRIAEGIFLEKQDDIVPLLVTLLENQCTPRAVALLEQERHRPGAPLIRCYCNLALYRAEIDGPYEKNLRQWVENQCQHPLLELRPVLPWTKRRDRPNEFILTPDETSALLIDSYAALAARQDQAGIDALLKGIAKGHPDNRYALAALLMKATE